MYAITSLRSLYEEELPETDNRNTTNESFDVFKVNQSNQSESDTLCRMKRGRDVFPNKQSKRKLSDPDNRAKLLTKVRKIMDNKNLESIDQLFGFYAKVVKRSTQQELEEHLGPDRLKPYISKFTS